MVMRALPRRLRGSLATPGLGGVEEPVLEPRPEVVEARELRWIQIDEPRLADRLWLSENFEFHELDLEDVASRNQRPKVDEYPDYLFLVMQFPSYDKVTSRLHAAELDVFVGRD
jgi:magnesium transporter